ncbi:hypothetical protein DMUE_1167 [Dictyocoela muelleri]|nr:hypothetical protein DMUE_1167 [Dictyocoela muelleri]
MLVINFEISVYNAFKKIFPNCELKSCNFHFNQIVVRYMNENNILEKYKNDANFKKYVKYLLSLSFIPESNVIEDFNKIKNTKRDDNEYNLITNFFEKNFLNNNLNIKKINFWSAYQRVINDLPTTTNSSEAYHKYLNSKVTRKNTSLCKVVVILKKEEMLTKLIIQNIKSGIIRPKKNENYRKNICLNYELYDDLEFYENLERLLDIYIK